MDMDMDMEKREMDRPGSEGQWNPPQRICGGVRRVVVTEEQRYGPRWLCDNDDDDDMEKGTEGGKMERERGKWRRRGEG